MAAARAMLADIEPAAGIEAMLACQMVATHEAAMACLSRSAAPDQSPEQTDQNLKHAERLMAIYTRQVDVLGRHRIREQELRERLDQQRRQEEWQAKLDRIHARAGEPCENFDDPDWDDEDDDDVYADVCADGATGDGTNGHGENDGRRDPDPGGV